jgi:hypothetical protein
MNYLISRKAGTITEHSARYRLTSLKRWRMPPAATIETMIVL